MENFDGDDEQPFFLPPDEVDLPGSVPDFDSAPTSACDAGLFIEYGRDAECQDSAEQPAGSGPLVADQTLLARVADIESPEAGDAVLVSVEDNVQLAAAGLRALKQGRMVTFRMTDPTAFAGLLAELTGVSGTAYTLKPHVPELVSHALRRVSEAAASPDDQEFQDALIGNAPVLARELERLYVVGARGPIRQIEELAAAYSEGCMDEWRALWRLHILDNPTDADTAQRYATYPWPRVSQLLENIQAAAPYGAFATMVRERMVNGIRRAGQGLREAARQEATAFLFAGPHDVVSEEALQRYTALLPLLHHGANVVLRALPEPERRRPDEHQ